MQVFTTFLPYITLFLTLTAIVGAGVAFRLNYSREADKIQDRVIAALKNQIEVLEKRADTCDAEIERSKRVLDTIRHAFKRRGIIISINKEFITVIDEHVSRKTSVVVPLSKSPDGKDTLLEDDPQS